MYHILYDRLYYYLVFLTHVSIRQMLMWLPMWKAKSLYRVGTFLSTWFFLLLEKFKTSKIPKPKQIHAHYIFQRYFQMCMLYSLSLANCKQHRLIEYLVKYIFLKTENCWREFHFCWHEIDNATFASSFFCWCEIIWVRKTVT